jgi:mannan endo-1,4-beta-mannosidase
LSSSESDPTENLPVPEPLDPPGRRSLRSPRARALAIVLALAMVAVCVGVWMSPPIRRWARGPTDVEVDLATEQARSKDLKRRVDELTAQLEAPRPPGTDKVLQARADDLARQVDELSDRLGLPRPPVVDGKQRARADDLARQNDRLEAALRRARPPIDPLALVKARLTKAEIVGSRGLFGMYTAQSPFNFGEVDLVQGIVQRKANMIGYFQSWNDPFDDYPIKNAWSRGQIPLMTWESQDQVGNIKSEQPEFRLNRIYEGAWDDYIRSYARGIKALNLPVIIRLDHEMNGNWYPWSEWSDVRGIPINGNAQGDYPKMWRHVHDIFAAEGANDLVIWLWSPNRVNRICGQRRPGAFYPGDEYVDWIGSSGYFRDYDALGGACDDISPSFAGVFGNTLPELRRITGSKPILLSEIGATERGGQKAAWITDLFRGMATNTDIIGFAWFSLAVSSGGETDRFTHDWRVNSSPEAQNAMRDNLAHDGYGLASSP